MEDGAKMAEGVNGKREECHIIIIYVPDDAVAVGDDACVGVALVFFVSFSFPTKKPKMSAGRR